MTIEVAIIDKNTGKELWTALQCAEHCGITRAGWTSYTAQGRGPQPVARWQKGNLWFADEVIAWRKDNPGKSR